MNQEPLFRQQNIRKAITALRADLIHEEGPRISTMRNYRFAILQYDPREEFELRSEVQRLSAELMANGWVVFSIDLHKLLLERIRSQGDEIVSQIIEREKRTSATDRERGLNYLKSKIIPLIEGPDGIAADCRKIIRAHAERYPDQVDYTLALIGRAGALYPFFRSSALLRHLDGGTGNIPVVLLYPGKREKQSGLSFMEQLQPDSDYRPRIYP